MNKIIYGITILFASTMLWAADDTITTPPAKDQTCYDKCKAQFDEASADFGTCMKNCNMPSQT